MNSVNSRGKKGREKKRDCWLRDCLAVFTKAATDQ